MVVNTFMTQAFWYKIFNIKYEIVLAVCDKELLDKTLKGDNIKIKVNEHFYKGNVIDEDGVVKLMNAATIGNFIGEKIVNLAEKEGLVTKESILSIGGVPHAQFVKIE